MSLGGSVGVIFTTSAEAGHAYGPKGEFGCTATGCTGFTTDIGISATVMSGFYYKFDDIEGKSVVTLYGASFFGFGGVYGTVKTPGGRKIGDVSGVSASISPFPLWVTYSSSTCTTIMNAPGCSSKKRLLLIEIEISIYRLLDF